MNPDIILQKLRSAGFEAYYVGGCVRDRLMDKEAHDVDIATNAHPEDIINVFSECTVIPTGLKHGTVTLIFDGVPYEITTYRVDGAYFDSRRPDSVRFTEHIEEDLARRDFTMNAIAMDISGNIVDPFGGSEDIKKRVIKCVGDPEKRFGEDALRIMRAVRFASQLGFAIDPETSAAIHSMAKRLSMISRERVRDEIDKLICGKNCIQVLLDYSDVIAVVIPEITPCIGLDQHSDFHCYDVWEHTVRAMSVAPPDDILLRRSLFFHDIGKPQCAKFDEKGKCHFKGHAEVSADMAMKIMRRLRYDGTSICETSFLIRYHSEKIRNKIDVKKLLYKLEGYLFFKLIEMKKCDNSAKNSFVLKENIHFSEMALAAQNILESGECYSFRQLAVNGDDLLALGLSGKAIGQTLKEVLYLVIEEKLCNDKLIIINFLKRR